MSRKEISVEQNSTNKNWELKIHGFASQDEANSEKAKIEAFENENIDFRLYMLLKSLNAISIECYDQFDLHWINAYREDRQNGKDTFNLAIEKNLISLWDIDGKTYVQVTPEGVETIIAIMESM